MALNQQLNRLEEALLANKPAMYPDVFRMLVEHLPSITPDDAKNFSRMVSGIFASFKEDFAVEAYFGVFNPKALKKAETYLRWIMYELSRRY